MNAEAQLEELGLELPKVPKLEIKYVPISSSLIGWRCRTLADAKILEQGHRL